MFSKTVINRVVKLADRVGAEPAALLAVAEVESGGVPEWDVGDSKRPAIRFEGHYFHKRLKGDKLAAAVAAGLASPKVGGVKNPASYGARYALLDRAVKIDKKAAYESTSWGLGQVMGAHWKKLGFKSVEELVETASAGVDGQIEVMARYIEKFGLADELQGHQWAKFAAAYNGPAYKSNRYDTKMAAAYKNYTKVLGGFVTSDGIPANGNDTVKTYQKDLKRLGFYAGDVDGMSGPKTKAAVKAFQKANGLVADGVYGKMTDEAVDAAIAKLDAAKGDTAVKTGTGATGAGVAVDMIQTQAEKLDSVSQYSHIIGYVVAALVISGVALTLFGLWKKYKANGMGE